MKRIYILLLVVVSAFSVFAGNADSLFFSAPKDTIAGKNLLTSANLHGKRYSIVGNKKISEWNGFSGTENILLQIDASRFFHWDNKKYLKNLAMLNPETFTIDWTKDIRSIDNSVHVVENNLFVKIKKQTYRLDLADGKELWKLKREFYYALPEKQIGLFYPNGVSSDNLWAVNLNNGRKIWETKQSRRFGWDDVYLYDPETLLIASEGFSLYNIYNGEKGSYKAKTSYSDATKRFWGNMALAVITTVMLATMEEVAVVPEFDYRKNISSNIMSNISIDSEGNLYVASLDKISRVSKSGKTLWSRDLPKKETSKSSVFLLNGKVYLVNRGYALYNGSPTRMGRAFLAAYDMETGESVFSEKLSAKDESVDNFQVIGNTLYVIMNDNILAYGLETGTLITSKLTDSERFKQLRFVDEPIFVKTDDGQFIDISQENSEIIWLINGQNQLIAVNEDLLQVDFIERERVFEPSVGANGFLFLRQGRKSVILHNGIAVAELSFAPNGFISAKNRFYQIDTQGITEVDLNPLVQ